MVIQEYFALNTEAENHVLILREVIIQMWMRKAASL